MILPGRCKGGGRQGTTRLVVLTFQYTVLRAYCLSLWSSDAPSISRGNLKVGLARPGLAGLQRGWRDWGGASSWPSRNSFLELEGGGVYKHGSTRLGLASAGVRGHGTGMNKQVGEAPGFGTKQSGEILLLSCPVPWPKKV